jgi:uncharacterized membrane protein YkvA (DUF1232 family)
MPRDIKAKLKRVRIGHLRALGRFFRDPQASLAGKIFVAAAIVYVISPLDAIPDAIPVIGWLDDLGIIGAALAYLSRVLDRYRHPVIEVAPASVPEPEPAYARTSR